jgi:hypothetical protein
VKSKEEKRRRQKKEKEMAKGQSERTILTVCTHPLQKIDEHASFIMERFAILYEEYEEHGRMIIAFLNYE